MLDGGEGRGCRCRGRRRTDERKENEARQWQRNRGGLDVGACGGKGITNEQGREGRAEDGSVEARRRGLRWRRICGGAATRGTSGGWECGGSASGLAEGSASGLTEGSAWGSQWRMNHGGVGTRGTSRGWECGGSASGLAAAAEDSRRSSDERDSWMTGEWRLAGGG